MSFLQGDFQPRPRSEAMPARTDPQEVLAAKLELLRARQFLASSLDALDVGLEIWDEKDRLVLYNQQDNHLRMGFYAPEDIGKTYETLLAVQSHRETLADKNGDGPTPAEPKRAYRATHQEPALQELPYDRWVKNYEATTPEGYLLVVRVNVTEMIRQGRKLEANNRRLTLQSTTDSLTGIGNRRHFDEMLAAEWQRAMRNGTDLSLLMVDIDHFKKYNDYYGHMAGDACLRRVAEVLNHCVRRAGELVARYGGEEFVVLLPATDPTQAYETAEKCLHLLQEEGIAHAASPTSDKVTLSIGVACLQKGMLHDVFAMLNAADAAMYRAKSEGRARCVAATPADWEIDGHTPRTPSP